MWYIKALLFAGPAKENVDKLMEADKVINNGWERHPRQEANTIRENCRVEVRLFCFYHTVYDSVIALVSQLHNLLNYFHGSVLTES